jgi:hypothetical protein
MNSIALRVRVGIATCAVAASATLIPITTAEATPAVLGPAPVPTFNWHFGSADILRPNVKPLLGKLIFLKLFSFHGCYHHGLGL